MIVISLLVGEQSRCEFDSRRIKTKEKLKKKTSVCCFVLKGLDERRTTCGTTDSMDSTCVLVRIVPCSLFEIFCFVYCYI